MLRGRTATIKKISKFVKNLKCVVAHDNTFTSNEIFQISKGNPKAGKFLSNYIVVPSIA